MVMTQIVNQVCRLIIGDPAIGVNMPGYALEAHDAWINDHFKLSRQSICA